jgi:membrane associated rhomboid family serine protease
MISASLLIVIVTSIVSLVAFSERNVFDVLKFDIYKIIKRKEYYRLISSGLIHADLMHLTFNMISFYSFASSLEKAYGLPVVVLLYISAIVLSSLTCTYVHRKNNSYSAVGASGGVCGILYGAVFLIPGFNIRIFLIPISIPDKVFAIIYLLFSYVSYRQRKDNIGHEAHIAGALAGTISAGILSPTAISQELPLLLFMVLPLAVIILIDKKIRKK